MSKKPRTAATTAIRESLFMASLQAGVPRGSIPRDRKKTTTKSGADKGISTFYRAHKMYLIPFSSFPFSSSPFLLPKGHLQADAYGGYDGIYTRGTSTEVACMAHARRKLFDAEGDRRPAMRTDAALSCSASTRSRTALSCTCPIDEEPRPDDGPAPRDCPAVRQARSVADPEPDKTWLDTEQKLVLPRSPLAAAITYMLNQWIALCVFATRRLPQHRQQRRRAALKRRHRPQKWLFAGNWRSGQEPREPVHVAGQRQRHGLDPQKYMMSVLSKSARRG